MDEYARKLLDTRSEVEEVIVFGSFENDTYAPGSDLDVFIVLSEADDSPLLEAVRKSNWRYRR
jgi:predicted nucleotidyltransferase